MAQISDQRMMKEGQRRTFGQRSSRFWILDEYERQIRVESANKDFDGTLWHLSFIQDYISAKSDCREY